MAPTKSAGSLILNGPNFFRTQSHPSFVEGSLGSLMALSVSTPGILWLEMSSVFPTSTAPELCRQEFESVNGTLCFNSGDVLARLLYFRLYGFVEFVGLVEFCSRGASAAPSCNIVFCNAISHEGPRTTSWDTLSTSCGTPS